MSRQNRGLALLLSSLMVLSVLGAGIVAAQNNPSSIDDDEVYEISNDGKIQGWERAAFTLRTDDTTAATKITPPHGEYGGVFGESSDGTQEELTWYHGTTPNPIGVHSTKEDVTIEFDQEKATYGNLDNEENVQFVAARLTPQDGKSVPETTQGAMDLFSSIDKANKNASFKDITTTSLENGKASIPETFQNPGNWIIFAAVVEDGKGFQINSGDISSVEGDTVIIGVDHLAVQEAKTTVNSISPSNPNPGEDITFDIDAEAFNEKEDVTHAVAVYDASTFEESRFEVVVDESELGPDFSASDDIQLKHSIKDVNGVADVEPGTTINGHELTDGRVSQPGSVASIIDFLADEAGTDDPNTQAIKIGDPKSYQTIDASVTVVNDRSANAEVTVETNEDFSTGDYRYVVLSSPDGNEQRMSTNTDTITLSDPSGGGDGDTGDDPDDNNGNNDGNTGSGGGGGGGAAPSPSAEFDITDATINETVIESGDTVGVNVTIENTGDADGDFDARLTTRGVTLDEQTVDIDEGASETVHLNNTFNESGAYNLKINNDFDVGMVLVDLEPAQVAVNETRQLADEAPDQPGLRVGFRNVSVTNITFSNESATGNVSVEDLTRVPRNITQPNGSVVQSTQITVPESERNRSATVQMRVNASQLAEFNASAEELVITRYNDTSEEWEDLNTSVISSDDESVLLEAETPGFSLFAVTAPQEEETTPTPSEPTPTPTELTATPTETDTTDDITTDTPDDTPTETDSETLPGFGAIVALIALLAAALLAMRRQ
ncbi:PGF-pre-PGF domain-containing protein [Natronomonas gomsonensis]|uniref:PGF-pre-PGF domain-containing protein n=1 Tax=Natronomonas gomsonensis TaxID=1046043 RepID=UPI0015BA5CB3|nr:PGF-pre-PGF domain-containing protein [Natronomonas gomsonensis]